MVLLIYATCDSANCGWRHLTKLKATLYVRPLGAGTEVVANHLPRVPECWLEWIFGVIGAIMQEKVCCLVFYVCLVIFVAN